MLRCKIVSTKRQYVKMHEIRAFEVAAMENIRLMLS